MQDNKRLAALLAADLHIQPPKLGADARAECFGDGFLGSKPRRQKGRRHLIGKAILDLVRMQNAVQESLPKLLVRGLNARHFDYVNARA